MTNKKTICFLMPGLSKSAEDPWQIVGRCDRLAEKFQLRGNHGEMNALLLSYGFPDDNSSAKEIFPNLQIHLFGSQKVNLFVFVFKAYKILRRFRNQGLTLIAGDNYLGLLLCVFLKCLLGSNIAIQISIHGNPLSSRGSMMKVLGRRLAFTILVPRASSVRLVSPHLESDLGKYLPRKGKIFVSPIPVRMPEIFENKIAERNVGFIGRLHYERGVELFCQILEVFTGLSNQNCFTVIGEGPDLTLLDTFRRNHPDFSLKILGSLSQGEVLVNLMSMRILINCAQSEGYGLAMREAITSGTYVVALSNAGTKELQEIYPDMVYLFNSVQEAVDLINSLLEKSPNMETVRRYRAIQSSLDEKALNALVESWI